MASKMWIQCVVTIVFGLVCGQVALESVVPTIEISISSETVQEGDDVTVSCLVKNPDAKYFMFWMKRQGTEKTQMGTNNFPAEVFEETGRYTIDTDSAEGAEGGSITFILSIKGVVAEDSGDIGCSIPGVQNSEEYVTLDVATPIQGMKLFSLLNNQTRSLQQPLQEYEDGEMVLFHIGQYYYFGCVAKGSNPAPNFVITIGDLDATEQFRRDDLVTVTGDTPGLGKISHTTSMITESPVLMDYYSKALELKCTATVPYFDDESIHITPKLEFRPEIDCANVVKAPLYEDDVVIECLVLAMPDPQFITWTWMNYDQSPETIRHGQVSGSYHARLIPMDMPGQYKATLTIAHTYPQHFRFYKLNATNSVGSSEYTLELALDKDAVMKEGASAVQVSISMMLLLLLTAIFNRS